MTRTVVSRSSRNRAVAVSALAGGLALGYGLLFVHWVPIIVVGGVLLLMAGWWTTRR